MGQNQQVLDRIQALQDQMGKLPAARARKEGVEPWNVREGILNLGYTSALALGEWQRCLDFNAAILTNRRSRRVSTYEIIASQFNNIGPLIELGRLADAERTLQECQQVFEDQSDLVGRQRVLGVRAALEERRGRPREALELQRAATRLVYVQPEPWAVATTHHQLASRLTMAEVDPAAARAHLLAAALLYLLVGVAHELGIAIRVLAAQFRRDAGREDLPDTLDEVIRVAEQTEGVHLDRLIATLQPDRQAVADTLAEILRAVADTDPR